VLLTRQASSRWLTAACAEVLADRSLDSVEKLVLLVLIRHTTSSRECSPTYQTIANDASLSRRAVVRIVGQLVRKRRIVRIVQFSERTGTNTSNRYRILIGAEQ
jgi:hypothetical protein